MGNILFFLLIELNLFLLTNLLPKLLIWIWVWLYFPLLLVNYLRKWCDLIFNWFSFFLGHFWCVFVVLDLVDFLDFIDQTILRKWVAESLTRVDELVWLLFISTNKVKKITLVWVQEILIWDLLVRRWLKPIYRLALTIFGFWFVLICLYR